MNGRSELAAAPQGALNSRRPGARRNRILVLAITSVVGAGP